MNLTHVIATALAGAMMLEATGLAQTAAADAIVPISRVQAVHVLVTNIQVGSSVHVELLDGSRVEGRLLEVLDDDLALIGVRFRHSGCRSPEPAPRDDERRVAGADRCSKPHGSS